MRDSEVIEGLIKWAATQPDDGLVGNLKSLAKEPQPMQQAVVGKLMELDAPVRAPTMTQVVTDAVNPFGKPLANRPKDWGNPNALPDLKAGIQSAGTNLPVAINGLVKTMESPSSAQERWYKRVISSPVNAGFSNQLMNVLTNRHTMVKKSAVAPALDQPMGRLPISGPEAIAAALENLDLDQLHNEQLDIVKAHKKTRRPDAVRLLGIIEGFRRSGTHPKDLMLSKVPVIPPKFRPFNMTGDTFIPGDANELYRDLLDIRDAHTLLESTLGPQGAAANKLNVYDAVKATYGYGDPVKAKTRERGVSGFLQKITGTSPKFSAVQRTLVSKPVDFVGRGVIGLDPELQLDQIGIPEDMAWKLYSPFVQRRMVRSGYSPADAVKSISRKESEARKHLDMEMQDRPTMYSRAPAWHKFNTVGGWAKIIPGKTILINPLVGTGLAADHDGDQMNVHVPSMDDAVNDVRDKLMPSKMLFSIKDPEKVVPVPKHEYILGLYQARNRDPKDTHTFATEDEAMSAIKAGKIRLSDEVTIGKPKLPKIPKLPTAPTL